MKSSTYNEMTKNKDIKNAIFVPVLWCVTASDRWKCAGT